MAGLDGSGTTAGGAVSELVLNAAALGALLELNEVFDATTDDHSVIFKRLCGRIAPHHPGSLAFVAEEMSAGELSIRNAEGMGAAILADLRLPWPADDALARFDAHRGACSFWRVRNCESAALGLIWQDVFSSLDAGELAMARLGSTQPALYVGVLAVKRNELRPAETHLLDYVAKVVPRILTHACERRALRLENRRLRLAASVFEHAMEGVIITDAEQRVVAVNRSVTRVTGFAEEELIGATPRILNSGRHDATFYRDMWVALRECGHWKGEIWNRRKSGDLYPELLSISAIHDEHGGIGHYLGIFIDITPQKEAEHKLHHLAFHDPLTGLPNREGFRRRMEGALQRGGRLAVLLLDVDRFKYINETFGHPEGDVLLKGIAMRLQSCLRPSYVLSRLGGDEFAVLIEGVTGREEVVAASQRIHEALQAPFAVGTLHVAVTASIGASLAPDDGVETNALLRHADAAMYEAKRVDGGCTQFYMPRNNAVASRRLEIECELRHAIERNELRLYYQTQVDLATGTVTGVEALLRWHKPGIGLVGPAQFIPMAETTGLIVPIGEWVLQEACRQCKAWQDAGNAGLQVAVNLSARQLRDDGLADKVLAALAQSGLPPECLELELTESAAMDSVDDVTGKLQGLRSLGVKLAVDDFGTGFSSLHYLKRFPVERVKIERSFVTGMLNDRHDAAIVNAIVALGLTLGLRVVAEGVNTLEQIGYLRRIGCHEAQGYYFSRPSPIEAVQL